MDSSTEYKPAPIIFGDESLSDVTLVVGQQEFNVHKLILACRSDVFKAMFYGDFKESKETRIEIKDVYVDNFRRLLDIIYTGKISDTSNFLVFPFDDGKHLDIPVRSGIPVRSDIPVRRSGTPNRWANIPVVNIPSPPPYKRFFHNFWKSTTEILEIADRFNITSIVKDYFGSVIIIDINYCQKAECHQCFNSFLLAAIHGLDISKCQKTYPKSLYNRWAQNAKEKPFPAAIPVAAVEILFQKLTD